MDKHTRQFNVISAIAITTAIIHFIVQVFTQSVFASNVALFIAASMFAIIYFKCYQQQAHEPFKALAIQNINLKTLLLIVGFSYVLKTFTLLILSNAQIANYCAAFFETVGMLYATAFVIKELMAIENISDNTGLNINLFMLFVTVSVFLFLCFSDKIIQFSLTHYWVITKSLWFSYLSLAFILTVYFIACLKVKDFYSNLCHLGAASFIFLHYAITVFAQLKPSDHYLLYNDILSKSALVAAACFLALSLQHTTAYTYNYIVAKRTINKLLLFSLLTTMLATPFALLLHYLGYIVITPMPLIVSTSICLIMTSGRLSLLLKETINHSNLLWREARLDDITSLPNQRMLYESMTQETLIPVLIVIDLQDFRAINDLYGYSIGDLLLKSFSQQLVNAMTQKFTTSTPTPPLISRLGNDDFAIILYSTAQFDETDFLEFLSNTLPKWWQIDQHRIFMTYQVGFSYNQELTVAERLHEADYQIREKAKTHHQTALLTQLKSKSFGSHLQLKQQVQAALYEQQVLVHLQPIFSLQRNKLSGFEVLSRLMIEGEVIYPIDFIDIIRNEHLHYKLITAILYKIAALDIYNQDIRININIPPQILSESQETAQWLLEQFQHYRIPVELVTLEIIENADVDQHCLKTQVQLLRSFGFKIALDDFGTGYSSFSRISALNIDSIKIDRSLVVAAAHGNTAPIDAIISLSQKHLCTTVAEGVETFKELEIMRRLGVNFVQGYLIGKPIDANKAIQQGLDLTLEQAIKINSYG